MSIADTIRNAFVPVHREGWPFIAAFGAATLLLGLFSTSLFWIGLILTGLVRLFLPRSVRVTPLDDRLVVSPADGIVSAVGAGMPPRELGLGGGEMTRISVFMNVFSCHVNRAPVRGSIARIEHRPGKFLNAELDKASDDNERNGLVIDSPNGTVAAVQIAGLVARRIVCWVEAGAQYRRRRAHRPDPLRLACRCFPAARERRRASRSARPPSPARPCSPSSAATPARRSCRIA